MTISDAIAHLAERISKLEVCELAPVALQLGGVLVSLTARMVMEASAGKAEPPDRLLDWKEARVLLGGISKDHLYTSPALRSIRVPVGRRVMFSYNALQRLITRRTGR
jgi:hypothetical protein